MTLELLRLRLKKLEDIQFRLIVNLMFRFKSMVDSIFNILNKFILILNSTLCPYLELRY
jgi:hypothetical protein